MIFDTWKQLKAANGMTPVSP